MMLRSSSTPILGSLLSSHSESPNNYHHSEINPAKQRYSPMSFHHHQQNHNKKFGSVHVNNSCQSLISPSVTDSPAQEFGSNGFRRAQSEGNLEGLLASSGSCDGFDEFENSAFLPKKVSHKPKYTMLESIPSFSVHDSLYLSEGEEACSDDDGFEEQDGVKAEAMLNGSNIGLEKSHAYANRVADLPRQEESQRVLSRMHMAVGLGIGGFNGFMDGSYSGNGRNGGGNGDKRGGSNDDDGGGSNKVEEHYKKMMEENPGDSLFMRNYAEFLYETKNDLRGAEEYYSRAILADPRDGEVLSQYAKVIWALHGDQDRASGYFERAVQAAPEDSQVLAAHASFLWDTIEDEDKIENGALEGDLVKSALLLRKNAMAGAKA